MFLLKRSWHDSTFRQPQCVCARACADSSQLMSLCPMMWHILWPINGERIKISGWSVVFNIIIIGLCRMSAYSYDQRPNSYIPENTLIVITSQKQKPVVPLSVGDIHKHEERTEFNIQIRTRFSLCCFTSKRTLSLADRECVCAL